MRVCLVSREYPPFFGGGVGTYVREAVHALAEAGCRVHVITEAHDETHPRAFGRGGVTVHRIPFHTRIGSWPAGLLRFAAHAGRLVTELAAQGEIDVVEFAECEAAGAWLTAMRAIDARGVGSDLLGPEGLIAEIEGRSDGLGSLGAPVAVHLHTPTEQLFALRSLRQQEMSADLGAQILAERAALLSADLVCAPSHFIAGWAHRRYGLSERPTVIPYPMRLGDTARSTDVAQRVLYAGRIEPRKGIESLLRAWALVARKHPDWRLRLAGADTATGPGHSSFWEMMRAIIPPDVAHTIDYLGSLDPKSLDLERSRAALCVIPSLWENFPNTCIEALAAGRAVVVSHRGGMAEMVGETEAGAVARAGDAESLAQAMSSMLSEGIDRLLERGRIGRARITSMCDPAIVAARRMSLYREAIDRATHGTNPTRTPDALRWWRTAQAAASGRASELDVPHFDTAATRWLEEEEARA